MAGFAKRVTHYAEVSIGKVAFREGGSNRLEFELGAWFEGSCGLRWSSL